MSNRNLFDRALTWVSPNELVILLLTSPLFLFVRSWLSPILLLLPLLWLARYRRCGHFVPRTPVDWPILGLMFMALTSALVTPDLQSSLAKISGLLFAIALFYALVGWAQSQGNPIRLAAIVVGLATATAIMSLFGTQWNAKWTALVNIRTWLPQLVSNLPGAEFGFNPNTVSGTLISFVPLQVALLWGAISSGDSRPAKTRRWVAIWSATLVATVGIIVLAQSRAAWAALMIGLLILGGILFKRARLVFLLLAIVCLVTLLALGPVAVSRWLADQGLMTASAELSWTARIERWSRWLWGIADNPLTGAGMDIYRFSAWDRYPFFYAVKGEDLGHAHNAYLHTAMDLGLPGLVSYLALIGGTLILGWRAFRQSTNQMTRLIVLGGVVGLGTHALWSLVDVVPLGARTNFLWWTVAALVISVVTREDWQHPPGELDPKREPGDPSPSDAGSRSQGSNRTEVPG